MTLGIAILIIISWIVQSILKDISKNKNRDNNEIKIVRCPKCGFIQEHLLQQICPKCGEKLTDEYVYQEEQEQEEEYITTNNNYGEENSIEKETNLKKLWDEIKQFLIQKGYDNVRYAPYNEKIILFKVGSLEMSMNVYINTIWISRGVFSIEIDITKIKHKEIMYSKIEESINQLDLRGLPKPESYFHN